MCSRQEMIQVGGTSWRQGWSEEEEDGEREGRREEEEEKGGAFAGSRERRVCGGEGRMRVSPFCRQTER